MCLVLAPLCPLLLSCSSHSGLLSISSELLSSFQPQGLCTRHSPHQETTLFFYLVSFCSAFSPTQSSSPLGDPLWFLLLLPEAPGPLLNTLTASSTLICITMSFHSCLQTLLRAGAFLPALYSWHMAQKLSTRFSMGIC